MLVEQVAEGEAERAFDPNGQDTGMGGAQEHSGDLRPGHVEQGYDGERAIVHGG